MRIGWALLFLTLSLAGCAEQGSRQSEPTSEGPFGPTPWRDQQWWRYDITRDGSTQSLTLVASIDVETYILVDDPEVAKTSVADQTGLIGKFEGPRFTAPVLTEVGLWIETVHQELRWLPKTLEANATWSSGETDGAIVKAADPIYEVEYEQVWKRWHATYNRTIGWFEEIRFRDETWHLVAHGDDYEGPLYELLPIAHTSEWIAFQTTTTPLGDSNHVRLTYDLACNEPGLFEFRLGTSRPVVDPIVSYQDVCPQRAYRVTWFEHGGGNIDHELNGAQGDSGAPLEAGFFYLDAIRIRSIS